MFKKTGICLIMALAIIFTSVSTTTYAADTTDTTETETSNVTTSTSDSVDTDDVQTANEKTGYIKDADGAIVYKKASKSSSKIATLKFNKKVTYTKVNSKWVYVTSGSTEGYVLASDISKKKAKTKTVKIKSKGFKSYMSYKAVGNTSSVQYKLQKLAKTGKYGIRTVNGRYCIAVGTGVGAEVGQYVDLVLKNGTVIECVVGDIKGSVKFKSSNGCVSEFIVSASKLKYAAKMSGDVSSVCDSWDSPVVKFVVYNTKVDL